jgi:hypothetical protein
MIPQNLNVPRIPRRALIVHTVSGICFVLVDLGQWIKPPIRRMQKSFPGWDPAGKPGMEPWYTIKIKYQGSLTYDHSQETQYGIFFNRFFRYKRREAMIYNWRPWQIK